ncbi:MAG: aspartyl protease family protein [Deltaproteobacteria bacterium]|nr:aspartyl protease family protein [Deltaproteobacteria bacterium]
MLPVTSAANPFRGCHGQAQLVRAGLGTEAHGQPKVVRGTRQGILRLPLVFACLVAILFLAGCDGASSTISSDSNDISADTGAPDADIPTDSGGGKPPDAGVADAGSYPPLVPVTIPIDGQVLYPVNLDGNAGPFLLVVDTGAVRTAVETTLLRNVQNGVGVITIDFGSGNVFSDYEVLAADLTEAKDHIGISIHGLIGQDIFSELYFGLDYRTSAAVVTETAPEEAPPGFSTEEGIVVPYVVDGNLGIPLVEARVGGKTARLIADTGSGVTILTRSFVEPSLLDSGLSGYLWYTSYGSDPATIVRITSIDVGGAVAEGTWAVVVPDDHHLRPVFDALGVAVDGFLGYPFYRRFFTAIDVAAGRWEFYSYNDLPHVPAGEWDRVGVEIAREGGEVVIDMVFSPSDAEAKGVSAGDVLRAIDGQGVEGKGLDDLRLELRGVPGETRTLVVSNEGVDREVEVSVDRLLP